MFTDGAAKCDTLALRRRPTQRHPSELIGLIRDGTVPQDAFIQRPVNSTALRQWRVAVTETRWQGIAAQAAP